jgi:hypothetical protein
MYSVMLYDIEKKLYELKYNLYNEIKIGNIEKNRKDKKLKEIDNLQSFINGVYKILYKHDNLSLLCKL